MSAVVSSGSTRRSASGSSGSTGSGSVSRAKVSQNQLYSTAARCLTRPSRVVPDGTTARRSEASSRPSSFHSTTSRCRLRLACRLSFSPPCEGHPRDHGRTLTPWPDDVTRSGSGRDPADHRQPRASQQEGTEHREQREPDPDGAQLRPRRHDGPDEVVGRVPGLLGQHQHPAEHQPRADAHPDTDDGDHPGLRGGEPPSHPRTGPDRAEGREVGPGPVSYTHLTLPTIYSV